MKKTFALLSVCASLLAAGPAYAAGNSDVRLSASSYSISVMKVVHENGDESTYAFKFCKPGQELETCDSLGSSEGYTKEQIIALNGVWTQIKAFGLGAGDLVGGAIVGAYAASFTFIGSVSALGIGSLGTSVGLIGGAAAGISVPVAAIKFIDAINPVRLYRKGSSERTVERNVKLLMANGEASLVIYSNTDPSPVLNMANQIESVLQSLE